MTADIIMLAERRKAREFARRNMDAEMTIHLAKRLMVDSRTEALAMQLEGLALMLALLAAWLALGAALADVSRRMYR